MTLNAIKARCFIDDEGHWIWKGAMDRKFPKIWAPNYSIDGAPMKSQTGRRAVWQVKTKKPIPSGWRVFGTCTRDGCISPHHIACGPTAEWGKHMADSGAWKGQVKRILANRATGRKLSQLDPDRIAAILNSNEQGVELAKKMGLRRPLISKVRTGKIVCFEPVGGIFSGLLAANETSKRRA